MTGDTPCTQFASTAPGFSPAQPQDEAARAAVRGGGVAELACPWRSVTFCAFSLPRSQATTARLSVLCPLVPLSPKHPSNLDASEKASIFCFVLFCFSNVMLCINIIADVDCERLPCPNDSVKTI